MRHYSSGTKRNNVNNFYLKFNNYIEYLYEKSLNE